MERLMTRRTKRLWTDEEKRVICAQTRLPSLTSGQLDQAANANSIACFSTLFSK
ncbi:MAG: hypothetical protein ACJAVS_001528 [Paracoccaceae bacterium]|jgi:hypothetical protein